MLNEEKKKPGGALQWCYRFWRLNFLYHFCELFILSLKGFPHIFHIILFFIVMESFYGQKITF